MKTKVLACALFVVLLISACTPATPATPAQPTVTPVNVQAIRTDTAATVIANITQLAASSTDTPEPSATSTIGITSTPTLNPLETATLTLTPTETKCDQMQFISDVTVPDNTEMSPGQEFTKTWKVKNIGACSWKTNYVIIYGWGDKMGGLDTALTAEILPNTEGEISINLKAPTPLGTYSSFWRLANNNGYTFGSTLSVIIVVK